MLRPSICGHRVISGMMMHTVQQCRCSQGRIPFSSQKLLSPKSATHSRLRVTKVKLGEPCDSFRNNSRAGHVKDKRLGVGRQSLACCANMTGVADPTSTKVGFCGIGIMGFAMAKNLIKAGYQVTVWNRSLEKCKPLEEMGAKVAKDPETLAAETDVVLAMLADPRAAEDVATSIAKGVGKGKGYVDISTIDGDTANRIKEAIHSGGGSYLEAPVSGSKQPAEQGALIFLCGGDKDLYEFSGPLLDVMGKAKFYLGEVGNGANMKLVVNMVMGTLMASFAEGLAFTEKAGLSQQDFIEISGLGSIAAPMFGLKGPKMKDHDYPTAFPLKHQRKDLELALKYAGTKNQSLPVAAASTDLFKKAETEGHGDADFSAVYEALQK